MGKKEREGTKRKGKGQKGKGRKWKGVTKGKRLPPLDPKAIFVAALTPKKPNNPQLTIFPAFFSLADFMLLSNLNRHNTPRN